MMRVLMWLCARRSAADSARQHPAADRTIALITMYANGFIVGEGAFRDSNVAENKGFLDDLKNGYVCTCNLHMK